MKTKEEIMKMSEDELLKEKWDYEINVKENNDCYDCFNCSNCSYCRYEKDARYKICGVQFTKEEYEKKIKELKEKSQ